MKSLPIDEDQMAACAGAGGLTKMQNGLWTIDWLADLSKAPAERQARLLSLVTAAGFDFLMDVEENPAESPIPMHAVQGIRGVGVVAVIRGASPTVQFARWLQTQQWLALAGRLDGIRANHLQWSVDDLFSEPAGLQKIVLDTKAVLGIVAYYDGDSWLLAAAPSA